MAAFAGFTVPNTHKDMVHDVAFNFYGNRLASVGTDHQIKIWDQQEDGAWLEAAAVKASHHGSVTRVRWGHPEFGAILATCSSDHTVIIWEERPGMQRDGGHQVWTKRAALSDATAPIVDVRFCPRNDEYQLALAACSRDGMVRIYEADDVMNLSNWAQMSDFRIKMSKDARATSLDWAISNRGVMLLAVGSLHNKEQGLQLYQFNGRKPAVALQSMQLDVTDMAFAPTLSRSFLYLAAGTSSGDVAIFKVVAIKKGGAVEMSVEQQSLELSAEVKHTNSICRLSWNATGTVLASVSMDGQTILWRVNHEGKWQAH